MEKKDPHISVNQFADFATGATPKKKVSILRNQKFPAFAKFASHRYNSASSVVENFMIDEKHDESIFEKKKLSIKSREITSDWTANDQKNSLDAIVVAQKLAKNLARRYGHLNARRASEVDLKSISVTGVEIKLNPDIVLVDKKSGEVRGAVKFIFSKEKAVTPMRGQIISGLMKAQFEKKLKTKLDIENFAVVDIFEKKIIDAPKSFSYHTIVIKKSCREILQMWPSILPKPDANDDRAN